MSAKRKILIWFVCASVIVAITLLAPYGLCWVGGPIFPAGQLLSLRGKTRADVRQILGEPSRIMEYGDWHYGRLLNPGYIAIRFDGDGRICGVNDEQVDPVTFGSGSWSDYDIDPPAP